MAIGPSLGELSGLIQDPNTVKYADFGLTEHEENRQRLMLMRAQMGDERAKVQLQAELQRQAEEGRNARAQQRMGFQREKFGFEQQKFSAGEDERRRGQLEAAYAQLRDAQDRGDAQGVSYARQALERLGATVEAVPGQSQSAAAPVPGATAPQPPPPPPPGEPPTQLDSPLSALSGIPRPRAARTGFPTSPPEPPPIPEVFLQEQDGPAGGPPPELPAAAAWVAPEASGAVTSGLAMLGGRIPPPGGPPIQPEPVQLQEEMWDAPQAAAYAAKLPGQPGDTRGIMSLGSMYYPRKPPEPPVAPTAPAQPSTASQPQPQQPGNLRVLQGGKPVLELGGAGAPEQVRSTLQSLMVNARTPEEKRSAQVALDVALGAVQRQGVEKAVQLGLQTYEREQNNNRKTRVGTGRGVGEEGFGGTGLSKDTYSVVGKEDAKRYDKVIARVAAQYGINNEVMRADSALAAVEAAMNSNTGTGQLAAVTKALKAMGNTGAMSDRDLNRIMESSGIWNSFKNLVSRAQSGTLPPELMGNLKEMTAQLRSVIQHKRKEAGEAARSGVLNDPFIYGDRDQAADAAFGAFAGYAPGAKAGRRGSGDQGSKKPAGGKKKIPMESLF